MIVDYPCPHEMPWTPKGKRKPRSFVYPVGVLAEIRDVASDEAPAVVKGYVDETFNKEKRLSTFRRIGDEWFEEREGGLTIDAVLADPTVLELCRDVADFEHWMGISRNRVEIAEGPMVVVGSAADLPEGKDASPPDYDPTDGRRDAILAAARDLLFVDGRLCRRSAEPTLVIQVSFYHGHPSYSKAELTRVNARSSDGMFFRADQMDRLATEFSSRRDRARSTGSPAQFGDLPEIEVLRPDLLEFDPFPDVLGKLAVSLLSSMKSGIFTRSVAYFSAFAELRDAIVPEYGPQWRGENIDIPTHVPADRLYEAYVPALREHLPYLCVQWNGYDERPAASMLEECIRKLTGTRGLPMLVRDFADDIARFEVDMPEGVSPAPGDETIRDDLAAIASYRP